MKKLLLLACGIIGAFGAGAQDLRIVNNGCDPVRFTVQANCTGCISRQYVVYPSAFVGVSIYTGGTYAQANWRNGTPPTGSDFSAINIMNFPVAVPFATSLSAGMPNDVVTSNCGAINLTSLGWGQWPSSPVDVIVTP